MSKRKLETEAEAAEQPIPKKVKEDSDSNGSLRSKFRPGLFDTDEFDKNFTAYSKSEP